MTFDFDIFFFMVTLVIVFCTVCWNDHLSTIAVLSEKCCNHCMIHNQQHVQVIYGCINCLGLRLGEM